MIQLQNYKLKKINTDDQNDIMFFKQMNQDCDFKRYFGKVELQNYNNETIFMNDYLLSTVNETVGYVHISDKIVRDDVIAVTLYYYIDPSYRENGIATQSLGELVKYLQEKENINYIILNIQKDNERSIKVAINNGFIKAMEDKEEIQFVHKTL